MRRRKKARRRAEEVAERVAERFAHDPITGFGSTLYGYPFEVEVIVRVPDLELEHVMKAAPIDRRGAELYAEIDLEEITEALNHAEAVQNEKRSRCDSCGVKFRDVGSNRFPVVTGEPPGVMGGTGAAVFVTVCGECAAVVQRRVKNDLPPLL